MDNKTEYFTLKEEGVIGWIEKYGCNLHGNHTCEMCPDWNLQSAISNAIEVSNQEDVYKQLFGIATPSTHKSKDGEPYVYPLQCHVEKKKRKSIPTVVALVTFSQPEDEMSGIGGGRPPDNEETYTPLTFDEAVKNRSLRLGATTFKEISELWSIACDVIEQMKTKPEEKETQEELWNEVFDELLINDTTEKTAEEKESLMSQFTITRKNP